MPYVVRRVQSRRNHCRRDAQSAHPILNVSADVEVHSVQLFHQVRMAHRTRSKGARLECEVLFYGCRRRYATFPIPSGRNDQTADPSIVPRCHLPRYREIPGTKHRRGGTAFGFRGRDHGGKRCFRVILTRRADGMPRMRFGRFMAAVSKRAGLRFTLARLNVMPREAPLGDLSERPSTRAREGSFREVLSAEG